LAGQRIRFKDPQIEKITFHLARLKIRKPARGPGAMSAEQRRLFEDALAEEDASRVLRRQRQADIAPPPAVDGERRVAGQ
jgi:transposase